MNYNNPSDLERMKHLIKYGMNEDVSKNDNVSKVEYSAKAADGKTYGIVKECNKFYIKVAPKKDTQVVAEDFDYIGGFMNKKDNEYNTYTIASKQLDLKLLSINEAYENKVKINQYKENEESDWQINETKEMRNEINRFNQILKNVDSILNEDKSGFTMEHTLPEAPASNPSDKKVNSPFTDTAVANGDKDFKKTLTDYEKAGNPFKEDGKLTNKEMTSDKTPKDSTDDGAYSEKPQYVETGVAGEHPKGGKVVKVNEKRTIKLTEEQVLAWNKNKDFMDKTNGTEIGSSAPFTDKVGEESNQTEAPTENIHENDVVHNNDNQNKPQTGNNQVGNTAPFDKKVNESDVYDIAGMPDEEVPFPEVESNGAYLDFEEDFNDWLDNEEKINNDDDYDFNDDVYDSNDDEFNKVKDFVKDVDGFDFNENISHNVNEDELHDFGQHPAYQKAPMTLPPNKEVAKNGAKDWNDKSVEGEKPFGIEIGDTAPFTEKVINMLTDAIMKKMGFTKKA